MTDPLDDIPALDPRAAALLAAHRRQRAMPPAARARVAARLAEGPALEVARAPEPDIPDTGTSGHVLEFMPSRRAERGWFVALAAAAALLIVWAAASRLQPVPSDSSAVMSPAQAAEPPARRAEPRAPTPAPERPTPPPAAGTDPPPAPRVPPARRPSEPPDVPPAPAPALDDLRAETELLARGWQALASGDIDLASATAREHSQRFTSGALVPERQALEAVAACRVEPARGQPLAAAFFAAHPRSPLARRVRDACELTR